jgi:hypothetical protein
MRQSFGDNEPCAAETEIHEFGRKVPPQYSALKHRGQAGRPSLKGSEVVGRRHAADVTTPWDRGNAKAYGFLRSPADVQLLGHSPGG